MLNLTVAHGFNSIFSRVGSVQLVAFVCDCDCAASLCWRGRVSSARQSGDIPAADRCRCSPVGWLRSVDQVFFVRDFHHCSLLYPTSCHPLCPGLGVVLKLLKFWNLSWNVLKLELGPEICTYILKFSRVFTIFFKNTHHFTYFTYD